jgi:GNAT superfamily N-acetyltransferase
VTIVPEGTPGSRPVVVTALEMLDPAGIRPAREPAVPARVVRSTPPDPDLSRRCYALVGGPWSWVDRLSWSQDEWAAWVERPGLELWTLEVTDELAGYFELSPEPDGVVELAYFGLVPGFEGRGLGGWMLTFALQQAWQLPSTRRVWVHTCELDGPAAQPNYLARGMHVCGSWTEHRLVTQGAR